MSIYRWVFLVFVGLLVLRLLGVYGIYFLEEDEISIAAGIAALVRDNVGDLYRYTPQIGYYRIMEWVTHLTGGEIARIPWLMKLWSVLAGALVPALGLVLFRDRLSIRERWLIVLALAVNPILWRSSQYGNTAIASLAFTVIAVAVLSNDGGPLRRVFALTAFGLAVFVRADAILLGPLIAFLLYLQVESPRRFLAWAGGASLCALAAAAVVWGVDPRLDGTASAVATHMTGEWRTQFWEYLIWAMSPLALGFAIWGLRGLSESRPVLFWSVILGCAGPMAFYFPAVTTPRYFLLSAVPLSIATAVGISDAAARLGRSIGPRLAWAGVLTLATLHLLVGMGQFPAGWLLGAVTDARIRTHDGPMPTGALLYDTYLRNGFLHQSFRNEGFGSAAAYWEPTTYPQALAELAGRGADQRVVLLFDAGWDHVFHFYAQEAGATYRSRAPSDPSAPFASETWLSFGPVDVMTIRFDGPDYRALDRLPVETGDEIWITGGRSSPEEAVESKLPEGLTLLAVESFDPRIRVFRAEATGG